MAIAPLEHRSPTGPRAPHLRLVPGGRRRSAPPRGAAVHARRDASFDEAGSPRSVRPEELAASRASHPSGARRVRPSTDEERRLAVARDAALAPRQAIRAQTLARRRRTTLVLAGLLALVTLAVPLRALGAVTRSGQATPLGAPTGLADGSRYTVAAGDTLWSIAAKVNAAAPSAVAHELAVELGTTRVVPGERIRIP